MTKRCHKLKDGGSGVPSTCWCVKDNLTTKESSAAILIIHGHMHFHDNCLYYVCTHYQAYGEQRETRAMPILSGSSACHLCAHYTVSLS